VLTAGQEKFEQTPNSSAREVSDFGKAFAQKWKSIAIHKERKYQDSAAESMQLF
jgi:hypothetical protein